MYSLIELPRKHAMRDFLLRTCCLGAFVLFALLLQDSDLFSIYCKLKQKGGGERNEDQIVLRQEQEE